MNITDTNEHHVYTRPFSFGENDRSGYVKVTPNLFHANDCRSGQVGCNTLSLEEIKLQPKP